MIAMPAVACGTKICSRPSPPPAASRANASHWRVMSRTTGECPVCTSNVVVFMASGPQVGSTVEVEYRAGGPGGLGRGQVDHGRRDLLRPGHPPERALRADGRAALA